MLPKQGKNTTPMDAPVYGVPKSKLLWGKRLQRDTHLANGAIRQPLMMNK
jgi:hypothetical protein